MAETQQLVVFQLDAQQYALPLDAVVRVECAVEVTPLPRAPPIVMGVVDVEGTVIPVVDIRSRFALPQREIELTDRLLIAQTPTRRIALLADAVSGVVEAPPETLTPADELLPDLPLVSGVCRLKERLTLIHDLDRFLSLDESHALERALDDG